MPRPWISTILEPFFNLNSIGCLVNTSDIRSYISVLLYFPSGKILPTFLCLRGYNRFTLYTYRIIRKVFAPLHVEFWNWLPKNYKIFQVIESETELQFHGSGFGLPAWLWQLFLLMPSPKASKQSKQLANSGWCHSYAEQVHASPGKPWDLNNVAFVNSQGSTTTYIYKE